VDFNKIQAFFAVIEHHNLSNAAHALRVSQPTLSRQMQALEHEFNASLFERGKRGMVPTEAGKRLYEGLQALERHIHALKGEVAAASVEPSGEVTFGIPPSPRTLLAVPLLKQFATDYPRVAVRIVEETSGELRDLVASGVLDLAVTNFSEPIRNVSAEPLGCEQMLLVGPPEAGLSMKNPIAIDDLIKLPLILTTRPNSLRMTIEAGLSRSGRHPNVRIEANALPLMTDLVTAGLGYTVLPLCGVRAILRSKRVTACPIRDFRITWVLARTKSRPLNLAAKRFSDLLQQFSRKMIAQQIWSEPD